MHPRHIFMLDTLPAATIPISGLGDQPYIYWLANPEGRLQKQSGTEKTGPFISTFMYNGFDWTGNWTVSEMTSFSNFSEGWAFWSKFWALQTRYNNFQYVKVKENIVLREIHLKTTGRHLSMGSHSVICYPTEVTAPPSPQPGRLCVSYTRRQWNENNGPLFHVPPCMLSVDLLKLC